MYPDLLQVMQADLISYGSVNRCCGKIETFRLHEDNRVLKSQLQGPGNGKVAVVDVYGDICAVVGDRLAGYAIDNGWAGIILNGYLRDTVKLRTMPIFIRALGTHPRRSSKRADGATGIPVSFGGVDFKPGAYLYADEDGIIVAEKEFKDISFVSSRLI
jgi:regulator of ribonuclease activity A